MAIENKVGSHEHSNQLNRYREIVEKEYPNYTKLFQVKETDEEADIKKKVESIIKELMAMEEDLFKKIG
ncbi:MAG: PD-(D/E)XK nuclease family protein [Lachnospiraceae bacterium]|nr:PD-(D/E)XK nuclease family protein [Lachnospiraceae bacterium]